MMIQRIVLIGAGKVAFHLGQQLSRQGLEVLQVFSRKIRKARSLARLLGAEGINELSEATPQADCYLLAVSDRAIEEVLAQLPKPVTRDCLVLHTSGATPATILKTHCKRYGIFYPVQSFSKERAADFINIPICIYANRKKDRQALHYLAAQLGSKSYELDDRQRAVLHVAAVFVNNFANHLFQIGEKLTEEEGIPFQLLLPLILETASKVQQHSPTEMQTGPAIRGDQNTLQRHLDYLQQFPQLEALYRQLSQSINPKLDL